LLDDGIVTLDGRGCTTFNEEEFLSCITFPDDIFSFYKRPGFEDVGDLGSFLGLKG